MKPIKLLILLTLCAVFPAYSQPQAVTDTITLDESGTASKTFNLLSNDVAPNTTVSHYSIQCKKLNPTTTYKSVTGLGRILVRANGTGTIIPLSTYTGGTYSYTIIDKCGLTSQANIVIRRASAEPDPEPEPDPDPTPTPIPTTFTLTSTSTTSAGVYDSNGKLVRTLWSNVTKSAGVHTAPWDGKNDAGVTVSGTHSIKVVAHNMTYTWSALIGNSSRVSTGSNKLRSLRTPTDGVAVGNYLYLSLGYSEGNTSTIKLLLSDLNYRLDIRPSQNHDVDAEVTHIATDGTRVYWAGFDPFSQDGSNIHALIYATNVSGDAEYLFSSGVQTQLQYQSVPYQRAIGVVRNDNAAKITGLAVMTSGNYLFSSHSGKNQVKCYNKTTGALVRTQTLTLGDIVIDGSSLFGISGNNVVKYTIAGDGTLSSAGVTISMTSPISLSVNNGVLLAIEGGTQQVKAYDLSGTSLWSHGQSGGYTNSPAAANDKFHFRDFTDVNVKGFVCQNSDGSFWVGDAGNCRTLRFSAARAFLNSVSWLPMNYNSAIDINNPDRVFAGFLEFNRTTGALTANWEANLPTSYLYKDRRKVFYNVATVSGRTIGTIDKYEDYPDHDVRTPEIVELTSTGLRLTGVLLEPHVTDVIESNGDLVHYEYVEVTSGTRTLYRRAFTGYDGSNNPTWAAESTVTSVPISTTSPAYKVNTRPSSKGYFFQKDYAHTGYHLGRVVGGQWVWQTSPSTTREYSGAFPSDGTFDIGNNVEYAGGNVYWTDTLLCWNYIGEFWKNNQVNIWNVYHQDGLMLMQVGKTGPQSEAASGTSDAPTESAGNAFSGNMVRLSNGDLFILYNDESRQGALGTFTITNTSSIRFYTLATQ